VRGSRLLSYLQLGLQLRLSQPHQAVAVPLPEREESEEGGGRYPGGSVDRGGGREPDRQVVLVLQLRQMAILVDDPLLIVAQGPAGVRGVSGKTGE